MSLEEFDAIFVKAQRQKPFRFKLESPSSLEEIEQLETLLGLSLPSQLKAFLRKYGAGYVGDINIFSASPSSEWYLPLGNRLLPPGIGFLAVSDDQTGGYFGFLTEAGRCEEGVCYFHLYDGDPPHLKTATFFDYVAQFGVSWR